MKQKELAIILKMKPQYMNAIIKGRRVPSAGLAKRLEMATGIDRRTWVWGSEAEKKKALNDVQQREVKK